jgi:hypothetical protein
MSIALYDLVGSHTRTPRRVAQVRQIFTALAAGGANHEIILEALMDGAGIKMTDGGVSAYLLAKQTNLPKPIVEEVLQDMRATIQRML